MITVIDKDGVEIFVGEPSADGLPGMTRRGKHDKDVAVYRNRVWSVTTMSRIRAGDMFRLFSDNLSPDRCYYARESARVVPNPIYIRGTSTLPDPDILIKGMTVQQLANVYATNGSPALSRGGVPFSPSHLLRSVVPPLKQLES